MCKEKDECQYSFRRSYRNKEREIWTAICSYGDILVVFDTIVITFKEEGIHVALFSNSFSRMNSESYIEKILKLFEDLTDGEGSFKFEKHFIVDPSDYYPGELEVLLGRTDRYIKELSYEN